MAEQLFKFFVVFFVVVEPISLIPVFAGLTAGASTSYQHAMAGKSTAIALGICVMFALAGAKFLEIMGIELSSFRLAGGSLLFLIALEMVFARASGTRSTSPEREESLKREDISVFPLAFPFIAGPARWPPSCWPRERLAPLRHCSQDFWPSWLSCISYVGC